jgi:uncharacterized membrane protein (DUF4010 family)
MNNILQQIPKDLINFVLTTVFSLLIGLEQRRRHYAEDDKVTFGSDRTFAFTGILGFILYIVTPNDITLYLFGGIALVLLLTVFYFKKIDKISKYGITSIIVLIITYLLPILIYTKPLWLTLLIITVILALSEMKEQFNELTRKFSNEEFSILAKFLVISGVILPLLPNKIIIEHVPFTPFKVWLAVVVVSGISYLSYLLQKFIFPNKGILITGFLGGLYSSTATTIVLSRKSKNHSGTANQISSAILFATSMMFLRIYILSAIFNPALSQKLLIPMLIMFILTLVLAFIISKIGPRVETESVEDKKIEKNPLEFKTALLFAVLFVVFGLITEFVLIKFGSHGLNLLSIIVGVSDIDPFLLSLFTGKYPVDLHSVATATLIAITSNNLLKMGYSVWFGNKNIRKTIIIGYSILIICGATIIFGWFL